MRLLDFIDRQLNNVTMYRLMVYGLAALLGLATAFSLEGWLDLPVLGLLGTTALVLGSCLAADWSLQRVYKVAANYESALITGLILACILPQIDSPRQALGVVVAGMVAIASKYVVAWQGRHVFNPAAFGATVAGLAGVGFASWWIGTPVMFAFVAIFGLLILRKLHRFELVAWFIVASAAITTLVGLVHGYDLGDFIKNVVLSGPTLFLAGVMLTEPATMPTRRYYQALFALLVGALFASQLHVFGQLITPQLALLAGNVFAFTVCFRRSVVLALQSKSQLSPNLYEFVFEPSRPVRYEAGQYMAWTLAHKRPDRRGNRRNFTLASSPTEPTIRAAVRLSSGGSSYKRSLVGLEPGDQLVGSQLAGDFTLPHNPSRRLVWIAGGIGITPFRSMAKYLTDRMADGAAGGVADGGFDGGVGGGRRRQVDLFYLARHTEDFVYRPVFSAAKAAGVSTHYIISGAQPPAGWPGLTGELTAELLAQKIGDLSLPLFYVAGPNAMVKTYRRHLLQAGVPRRHIVTDYFSGY